MNLYKIDRIEHSGTRGEQGTERVDGRYPLRKGSIVLISQILPNVGCRCVMEYVKDNQGNPKTGALLTTEVLRADSLNWDKNLVIYTLNSIYYLSAYEEKKCNDIKI